MYTQAHGAKTNNPIINVGDNDKLILKDYTISLYKYGFNHETEISLLNWSDYHNYEMNPSSKW
jgi:hypothetical protein